MKPILPAGKHSAWLWCFLLLCLFYTNVKAQVNLSYAANHAPITMVSYNPSTPYTISGYRIKNPNVYSPSAPHAGEGIYLSNCSNIVITNCIIGPTGGKGIYLEGCSNITITNCIFLDNSAGVITWGCQGIKINNNQFVNMQNDVPIGTWGAEGEYVQVRSGYGTGNEIKDNVGENILGFSNPVDAISLANSFFSSPCIISGNKLRGGGPSDFGGGIILGDLGGGNAIADNNTLVDPGQYGINVAGGNNYTVTNNKIYAKHQVFTNVGLTISDGGSSGVCYGHTITGNQVNYTGNWPLYSNTPAYNPFQTDYNCGSLSTVWSDNDFFAAIDSSILPERIWAPFPVAYLKFNSDLNDYCGSGLNATAYGSAGIFCDTYRKVAAFYGGSTDAITIPSSVWLKPSSQMISVSAWLKPDALTGVQGFIRSADADGWSDGWRGVLNGTNAYFDLMTNNGRVSVDLGAVAANSWNHVAFTYDGKKMKGYLNGVLVQTVNMTGYIYYNHSANLYLGWSEGTNNYSGKMAEVKIHQGIVNDAEIAADYSANVGNFDGTATNFTSVDATYYANGTSAPMGSYNEILPNSYGTAYAYVPDATNYLWEVTGGTPSYFNTASAATQSVNFSIAYPDYLYLKLTVSGCILPAVYNFAFQTNYLALLKVIYSPATKSIVVSEDAPPPAPSFNGGSRSGKLVSPTGGSNKYIVEVFNLLGQKIRSDVFRKGEKITLRIGNVAAGVYLVRVSDGQRVNYTKQLFIN